MNSKFLYKVDEVADQLSLGRTVVYQLIASGKLQTVKIGRSRRVPHSALEQFIQSLAEEANPEVR